MKELIQSASSAAIFESCALLKFQFNLAAKIPG
jgi:hypothetical protein